MTVTPNRFVDSDHPDVIAFAEHHGGGRSPVDAAVALFYAVRDGWRYSPWNVSRNPDDYRASVVLAREPREGHCIDKAVLLAASARALGIPARLHFADVRNHIATEKLEAQLGTNLLVYHGYTEVQLDGRWIGITPAFNASLCAHLGVAPLEFDGEHEALFQAYDRKAGEFMEYVTDHGSHDTLPLEAMFSAWKTHYQPAFLKGANA
ncbi:MAG: transglutaminase-like domain-containing protein [Myxococcota bacterium]